MKKITGIYFVLFPILVSCTTTETSAPPAAPTTTLATVPPLSTPVKSTSQLKYKSDINSYFKILYPKSATPPVQSMKFSEIDLENDYIKVDGGLDSYAVYKTFRSQNDHVLEQISGCGPGCDQDFTVFTFKGGKLEDDKDFAHFYPKKKVDEHFKKLIKQIPETDFDREPWLLLPKKGSDIRLLIVQINSQAKDKSLIHDAGVLTWNGASFDFKPLPRAKSSDIKFKDLR